MTEEYHRNNQLRVNGIFSSSSAAPPEIDTIVDKEAVATKKNSIVPISKVHPTEDNREKGKERGKKKTAQSWEEEIRQAEEKERY
jgi:hypothetical protein